MSRYGGDENWAHITQPESRKRIQNRLSQRRHRAKLRQQAESAATTNQSSETSSLTDNKKKSESVSKDFPKSSSNGSRPEDAGKIQAIGDDFEDFSTFDVQNFLSLDEEGSPFLGQTPSQNSSRPMTAQSNIPGSFMDTANFRSDAGSGSLQEPNSHALAVNPGHDLWENPDPQWMASNFQNSMIRPESLIYDANNPSSAFSRPPSRQQQPPPPLNTEFIDPNVTIASSSRADHINPSVRDRNQRATTLTHRRRPSRMASPGAYEDVPASATSTGSRRRPREGTSRPQSSASQFGEQPTLENGLISPAVTEPVSPQHGAGGHCTCCNCLRASVEQFSSGEIVQQRTPASTPTQASSHPAATRNLDILSDCTQALQNLVQAPDGFKNISKRRQPDDSDSSDGRSGQSSATERSTTNNRRSLIKKRGGGGSNGDRRKGVEKVVIVYMRGGSHEESEGAED